jgi:hypothetical protein
LMGALVSNVNFLANESVRSVCFSSKVVDVVSP